ncbi:phospholipase D family protein [Flavobacterium sp. 25HG05S-40]|uniref:phospholipase D family protein n=1 Tax=Flavobacterium sp. 25HG05S-40 TaxID=3458682 RepID=UPI004044CD78
MNIINNRTFDNHESFLLKSFKDSDEAIIISPFLSKSFKFIEFNKTKHLNKITLITTLKKDYKDQQCKINFFKNLFEFGKKESIAIEIFIDNSLHGKIYIFKKGHQYIKGIITSANFTRNGLKMNNEWGIEINDTIRIEEIANDLISNIVLEPITEPILKKIEAKFNTIPPPKVIVSDSIDLVKALNLKTNPLNVLETANYWLKPIGSTEDLISITDKFSDTEKDLFFAVKPRGVKIGDILIAYAVGYKKILSIYRVSSKFQTTTNPTDRWKYYIQGENLTRFYGNEWSDYNIHISDEREFFVKKFKLNATPSGKNSYGSLQQGADKLKITNEFGNYLIKKIVAINKEISFRDDN